MKTYSSGTKEKKTKKNFFMKNIYAILFGTTLLIVAGIVTLTLVLTNINSVQTGGKPEPEPQPTKPTFSMPIDGFTGVTEASLDSLVESSLTGAWQTHNGVDFNAPEGTLIKAAADGKVTSIEKTNLEGAVITITHSNGYVTVYKGLDEETKVKEGDEVKGGDEIGKLSAMMRIEESSGPHLHLEMTVNGEYADPLEHLPYSPEK